MATFKIHESLLWAAEAGADLTTSLNLLAKLGADGLLVLAGDGDKAIGPIVEVPLSASVPRGPATVQLGGIAKMVASAALLPGSRVRAAAGGKIQSGTAAQGNLIGVTLENASGNNSVVAVAMIA